MQIFFSGETGKLGAALIEELLSHGHGVAVLRPPEADGLVPSGTSLVLGDALDPATFAPIMPVSDTAVHLSETYTDAQAELLAAFVSAALRRSISQAIYVQLANPEEDGGALARDCEEMLVRSGLNVTIVRPWQLSGSDELWTAARAGSNGAVELFPPAQKGAPRDGLVSRDQLRAALVWAIENPTLGRRFLDVAEIRALASSSPAGDDHDMFPPTESETTSDMSASHEHGKSERRTKAECSAGHH